MALLRLEDFEPNYREAFGGGEIKGIDVYTENTDDKIGTVNDVLVDQEGRLRYLVVDVGFWVFGKKVLLPMGRSRGDWSARRVYASLSKTQAEDLPEFHDSMVADYDYEERVRGVYRTPATKPSRGEVPLEAPVTLEAVPTSPGYLSATPGVVLQPGASGTTYDYRQDSSLYDLNDKDHPALKLYEERLMVNKQRCKSGEVALGKHVETKTARAAVPVERERVVIERTTPAVTGTVVTPGGTDFQAGEVTRLEVYEETPDVRKEAFVREEVRVRKEVEQDSVNTTETLRREELDVNTTGRPVIDETSMRLPSDPA